MAGTSDRREQMFPTLTPAQIDTARRFASGPERRFDAGAVLFETGDREAGAWLVLAGSVAISRHGGFGEDIRVTVHHAGQLTGEISQLSGRASLTTARAGEDGATALPFDAAHLRALIVGSADVGEALMRAFILRRVALIEAGEKGGAGSILLGERENADLVRLSGFLTRNGYPYMILPACEPEGRELVQRLGVLESELPLMVCPDGTVLKRPSDQEAAACLGMSPIIDDAVCYDVAVIGAGPAGLATAVYAASEGLSVLVCDSRAFGGQAGASARIENYLGFPTGISGQALAGRAFTQALKFGAEVAIPLSVSELECAPEGLPTGFVLQLDNGRTASARTVVIASGARYRRPPIDKLDELEGNGVSYWASPVEARLCQGEEVALVGGGNSAGQAVAFLSPQVAKLHLVARRPLEQTMSHYLVERIGALPNVELHIGSEVVDLEGDRASGLTGAIFRDRVTGLSRRCELRHLFLFIGADPNTDWLNGCVSLDQNLFVLTGRGETSLPLETSRPGVFAVGDVRSGSTKRVAAAVGEGAAVVAQIHAYLARSAD